MSEETISKEDFNKVWKDSTREAILNQYYYDYMELQKVYSIIKEVREQINKDREKKNYEKDGLMKQAFYCNKTDKLLEILDKENKE